ncbi:MAG: type I glutamate--ammonia ligase [Deltaproteobacteria bacterium]|nr:type I glutamate--ammonia ligase [Deltaproteobacteria bacterium]
MTEIKNAKDALSFAKANEVQMVDFKFVDLFGTWQHFACPIDQVDEDVFEDGMGFDGSSVRGWKSINASDMLIVPDATTAKMDPFYSRPTLSLLCDVQDPITREPYERDPRQVAQKAEAYLKQTGIADTAYFGPEPEFFIFDDVRFENTANGSFYFVDSEEGAWNSGSEEIGGNLAYKTKHKGGYFPVPPHDAMADIRHEMVAVMNSVGLEIEREHHEVASGGQAEIDFKFDSLTHCGDKTQWLKYIVKNVARQNGKTATFMPKPLAGDNGSGMHVHQSLWSDGKPLFAGDGYGGLSEMAMFYIGGLLKHAPALAAITNPTLNSYRRLIPGYEAPTSLAYSARNRSASIRIPVVGESPKAKRLEARFPDATANPYLAFSALLMAGLDGIENKILPGEPLDKDIYGLSAEELKDVPQMPGSLADAMDALEKDHDFLLKGDVFTKDLIETFIDYKRNGEMAEERLRPTPLEFELYFDI